MHQLLVILDLDHTLLYCPDKNEPRIDRVPDFHLDSGEPGIIRPHALSLIDSLRGDDRFHLGVFTAAGENTARSYLEALGIKESELSLFFWSNRCTCTFSYSENDRESIQIKRKELKKVVKHTRHPLERIVTIDDSPIVYWRNYGNLVAVSAYTGQPGDNVLSKLYHYLRYLEKFEDVRPVEKRGWLNGGLISQCDTNSVFRF